jgi:hypothetical protein
MEFVDFLLAYSRIYGQNYFERAHLSQILTAHNWLFNLGGYWGWVLTVGASVTLLYWGLRHPLRPGSPTPQQVRESPFSVEEGVLTIVLLWLPLIAVAAALAGPGGMTFRYMLPTVLGGALAVGYFTSRIPGWARMLLLIMMCMNYGLSSTRELTRVLDGSILDVSLAKPRASIASTLDSIRALDRKHRQPVVISSGIRYLQLAYYTPSDRSRQLYALIDPAAAVKFAKSDSVDLDLLRLRQYVPLQVQDYAEFASRNPEFLLVSEGDAFDWWPARLSKDGHTLRLLSEVGNSRIYEVSLNHPDTHHRR